MLLLYLNGEIVCRYIKAGRDLYYRILLIFHLFNIIYPEKKSTDFTIGFFSRIDPKKGIELLFNALSQVNFNYRLMIAGSGDDKYFNTLKSLACHLNIADKIEWCGWMNGENKFRFMRQLDLFVLTSYNENFAIAVTESLAVGTAVLVSENVGLADYVKEKQLGFVCKTEVAAIKNELDKIYENRNDLVRIKKRHRKLLQKILIKKLWRGGIFQLTKTCQVLKLNRR